MVKPFIKLDNITVRLQDIALAGKETLFLGYGGIRIYGLMADGRYAALIKQELSASIVQPG
jgi:hypothetical protein